jgi:hypothetical protein
MSNMQPVSWQQVYNSARQLRHPEQNTRWRAKHCESILHWWYTSDNQWTCSQMHCCKVELSDIVNSCTAWTYLAIFFKNNLALAKWEFFPPQNFTVIKDCKHRIETTQKSDQKYITCPPSHDSQWFVIKIHSPCSWQVSLQDLQEAFTTRPRISLKSIDGNGVKNCRRT